MSIVSDIVLYLIFLILIGCLIYAWRKELSNKRVTSIPFKEAMDLICLPIVTFEHRGVKLHLMLDTGSDDSYINSKIADILQPVKADDATIPVITGTGETDAKGRVLLDLTYNNNVFYNYFFLMDLDNAFKAITDERGLEIHGIIGNKFFKKYEYKLDFESMIAHSKKGIKK